MTISTKSELKVSLLNIFKTLSEHVHLMPATAQITYKARARCYGTECYQQPQFLGSGQNSSSTILSSQPCAKFLQSLLLLSICHVLLSGTERYYQHNSGFI